MTTTGRLQLPDGQPIALNRQLAIAGEGSIHTVTRRPDLIAKIFHPDLNDLAAKLDKVTAMVASPPTGAQQADGFTVLTWPVNVIHHEGRGPVGYLMPRIDTDDSVEIHTLSNPSNRANPLPSAPQWPIDVTWEHLLTVAANLCLAVEVAHRVDAVIGDFQERNILVADTCRVTLVDCDSMQFTGPTGQVFHCGVGRPEFLAPELAGADLRTRTRRQSSDLFALAVHIHLLLMGGNHPFLRGTWTGQGDQPSPMILATAGHWAGGPHSPLQTHPLAPPITFLPNAIQELFKRAFTDGVTNPDQRPSATQWRTALLDITVIDCPRRTHQIPSAASSCPWCAIDDERGRRKQSATPAEIEHQTILRVARKTAPPAQYPTPPPPPRIQATPTQTGLAIGDRVRVDSRGDGHHGQLGQIMQIMPNQDDDLMNVIVKFQGDPHPYAFRRDELMQVNNQSAGMPGQSAATPTSDFWLNVGIDPIRIATASGVFLTLRCYVEDAPIFLGSGGQVNVFRAPRALQRFLATDDDHDMRALSTFDKVVLTAQTGALPLKNVTAENIYMLGGLGEDIAAGLVHIDPKQLDLAVELLSDLAEYVSDPIVENMLHPKQPLGRLVNSVATGSHLPNTGAATVQSAAAAQWYRLEDFLESRLRET